MKTYIHRYIYIYIYANTLIQIGSNSIKIRLFTNYLLTNPMCNHSTVSKKMTDVGLNCMYYIAILETI